MVDWQKKQLRRFLLGMAGYIVLLPISLTLIGSGRLHNTTAIVVAALMPVLPLLYAMAAVVENVRRQDELQQRTHLQAVLITALLTGGLSFSYGLLEATGLVPHLPTIFIAPFMIVTWGIANALISRRYE